MPVIGDTVLLCSSISPLQLIHASIEVSGSRIDLIVFRIVAMFTVDRYFTTLLPIQWNVDLVAITAINKLVSYNLVKSPQLGFCT